MDFLKKLFITHEGNDYKPHFLREASLLSFFLVVVVLFGFAVGGELVLTRTQYGADVIASVLVDLTNQDRTGQNLKPLTVNPILQKAAQLKADDMAKKGYFAHTAPDGTTPWHWFEQAGYNFTDAGENLAVNFKDSTDVNNAWLSSPGHRANIMRDKFTEIGIATAIGYYQGVQAVYVVQTFGNPAPAKVKMVPVVAVATTTASTTPPKLATSSTPTKKDTITVPKKPTPATSTPEKASTSTPASTTSVVPDTATQPAKLAVLEPEDLFISISRNELEPQAVAAAVTQNEAQPQSSFFEKLLASPQKSLSFMYLLIAIFTTITLVFALVIEVKRQHPKQVIIVLLILTTMCALAYAYRAVLFAPLAII
jgi:hypothetical protein